MWKQASQTLELQPSVLSMPLRGLFSQLAESVVVVVVVVVVAAVVSAVVAVVFVVVAATNRTACLTQYKHFKHSILLHHLGDGVAQSV
jgi:hypothetical protein